ncbi:ras and EF-hand domain-containing protein homolog isoform X2 [Leptopilina boulardi]|nr:ras and EF-hand domain-containing protein homolog isoform X2 [Leptopilina boulardi]XP_051160177.1 ras and EF-hand domain-containing protein homolog isoform X2 [Leptopilina boulardi]
MDHHVEKMNQGGSSPDTLIGRSSPEEDRKRQMTSFSAENLNTAAATGESSSSLETIVGVGMEAKKKGRFGSLKSSFRKEGGLFKMKKKKKKHFEAEPSTQYPQSEQSTKADIQINVSLVPFLAFAPHLIDDDDEGSQKIFPDDKKNQQQQIQPEGISSKVKQKKPRKTHSLVRKLSFNKFGMSPEPEPRHTPEGGDSSRSLSQSSQESTSRLDSSPTMTPRKESDHEKWSTWSLPGATQQRSTAVNEDEDAKKVDARKQREGKKGEEQAAIQQKSENLIEKPVSTITVVQRKSPSLTIKISNLHERTLKLQQNDPPNPEKHLQTVPEVFSTVPRRAISDRPDESSAHESHEVSKKAKLAIKSESESCPASAASKTSPLEPRRKSLLEEKRAIFQRRRFDSSSSTSDDTMIAVTVDEDTTRRNLLEPEHREQKSRKTARHISVRKFDTFSTFEGTFDEDTGVGYLAGIEEDYRESCEKQADDLANLQEDMAHAISENPEKSRSVSQESASSQNNVPSSGLGEKREHLYKILVIGELGAGKTSIIKRYVHQFFSQHYRATIGVDFALKVLNWDPHTIIRLQLWDIAGQERFGNMTRVYYKEAVGAFIVFDVTRSATLEAVVKWKQDLDSKVQLPDGSPIPCVLLANKCDQQKEGMVNTPAKMDEYCKEKNFAGWFETSAKENINIEEAARFLVNKILQNDQIIKGSGSQDQTDGERFALNQSPTSSKKSCAC